MWDDDGVGGVGNIGVEQCHDGDRGRPADELRRNERPDVDPPDPMNVSVNDRSIVTAGLANDVDAVNQYAATM